MTLMVVVTILRMCTRACMRVHASVFGEAGAGGAGSNFPALGTRQKMGLLSKTALGPSWRGSDPWKGWFRRGESLVAGFQFGVLGTKAASLKSKTGCVCVCVCVCVCGRQGARRGGGDGHSWRRMLGHFAVKASLIPGLEDQQKRGTT